MQNILENIPYSEASPGMRKLADSPHLLLMQVALSPGQAVPPHKANSNVHLLVLAGEVEVCLHEVCTPAGAGSLLPVAFGTPMRIVNRSAAAATFLVIKTPHPGAMD